MRLHPHPILEFIAYAAGIQYYLHVRKRNPDLIPGTTRLILFIWAAAGALLGARLLGLLEHADLFQTEDGFDPRRILLLLVSSKTIVGGLLGGLVGVEIGKLFLEEKRSTGDLYVGPLILAMIIGRIGCFLSGLTDGTHGLATTLPWGIDLGDGMHRHPAPLYEIIFLAALWFALRPRKAIGNWKSGDRFRVFLATYLLFRLFVENLKPVHKFGGLLSAIQLACISGLLYYSVLWTREYLRGNR